MPLVLFRSLVLTRKSALARSLPYSALNHASRMDHDNNRRISRLSLSILSLSLCLDITKHSGVLYRFHCFWSVYNAREAKRVTAVSTFAFPSNIDSIPFRCLSVTAKAFAVCEKFSDQLNRTTKHFVCMCVYFFKTKKLKKRFLCFITVCITCYITVLRKS